MFCQKKSFFMASIFHCDWFYSPACWYCLQHIFTTDFLLILLHGSQFILPWISVIEINKLILVKKTFYEIAQNQRSSVFLLQVTTTLFFRNAIKQHGICNKFTYVILWNYLCRYHTSCDYKIYIKKSDLVRLLSYVFLLRNSFYL